MIQIEYKAKGSEDVTVITVENKNFSMYNTPHDVVKELFPTCKVHYTCSRREGGASFCISDKFKTIYHGIMKGGKA